MCIYGLYSSFLAYLKIGLLICIKSVPCWLQLFPPLGKNKFLGFNPTLANNFHILHQHWINYGSDNEKYLPEIQKGCFCCRWAPYQLLIVNEIGILQRQKMAHFLNFWGFFHISSKISRVRLLKLFLSHASKSRCSSFQIMRDHIDTFVLMGIISGLLFQLSPSLSTWMFLYLASPPVKWK